MARDPGSMWSPLAESGTQGDGIKRLFIVHSTGDRGSAQAIYNYFNRPSVVVESTFVIGLGPEDPTRQLLDSSEVADANMGANVIGISVEVVGQATDPYTPWQESELIRLGRWARRNHPIPAQIAPSATGAGFGWHVQFGAPGPWAAVAKDCPGKTRIQRLKSHIFPAIFASEEDDMYDAVQQQIAADRHTQLCNVLGAQGGVLASIDSKLDRLITAIEKLAPAGLSASADAEQVVDLLAARLAD